MLRVVLHAWVTKTTAAEILANPATRRRQVTMTISLNPLRSTMQSRQNQRGFRVHRNPRNSGRLARRSRGLRTEFRPFSRVLRLKSPASLSPQNSVSRTTRWRGRSRGSCCCRHGEALALPLADTEAQPLERQDVQLPAFIVSQCQR